MSKKEEMGKIISFDEEGDELFRMFAEAYVQNESKKNVLVMERVEDVLVTYEMLSDMYSNDPEVRVTRTLHEPFNSSGNVEIRGKRVVIRDIDLLIKIIDKDACFSATCRTDGTCSVSVGFSGLMIKEEEKHDL